MKAFPGTPTFDQDANRTVWQEGMDLRDYFAAKAMAALITTPKEITNNGFRIKNETGFSEMAYKMADAMMEARNGNKE